MIIVPKIVFTKEQKEKIIGLYTKNGLSGAKIAALFATSSVTILKNLKEWGVDIRKNNALNLSNRKFGNLIAVKPAPKRGDKYTRWECLCSCGQLCEVRTDYLINGHTTSCGCIKKIHFGALDLKNKRFGRLIVIERIPPCYQKCLCDCGKETIVETSNLTSGNTSSCGCLQSENTSKKFFIDLTGKRFGKLVVVERVNNDKFNHVNYRCSCSCGGTTVVDAERLRNGTTSSCGCLKSKGEMIINNILTSKRINFIPQYSDVSIKLSSGRSPLFDFAILDKSNNLKCLIEYNGEQHYHITGGWNNKKNFEKTTQRDKEKILICDKLNIKLFIISYKDSIEKELEKIFSYLEDVE